MTHARHKGSLGQSHAVDRRDGQRYLRHPHGDDNMGGACAERSLRFGRTKKIVEVIAKRGRGVARRGMRSDGRQKHRGQRSGKPDQRRDKRRGRKLYPLRGRTAGSSEDEGLSCHVLLTRLEEGLREQDSSEEAEEEGEARGNDGARRPPLSGGKSGRGKCRKQRGDEGAKVKPTKRKAECDLALSQQCLVPEPRKRRMASLNAEAVNSLLLERATDQQPAAKLARKQQQQGAGCRGGVGPLAADPTRSGATTNATASAAIPEASAPRRHEPMRGRGGSKRVVGKAQVRRRTVAAMMSPERLNAPAPRRLAGLNAAALLKLTSSSGSGKPRARAPPTTMTTPAVAAGNDRKAPPAATSIAVSCQASVPTKPHRSRVRAARPRGKRCGSRMEKGRITPRLHGNSIDKDNNKNKADFEPKVEWEKGGCAHRLTQPGYQSRGGLLAYPLKPVKEEQVESELGPYYCCPPGGSVGYCHRLALFLGRSPAYGEAEEQPSVGPVKRECLVAPPTLTHGHAHAALTLGPHPCLCAADHCFSSYYVHIAHPPHTAAGTPSPGTVTASRPPIGFSPGPALCPGRVGLIPHPPSASSGKLLDPRGVAHHPACCGPVGSPCYAEACGIGSYAYRAMPPVATRGCSFSEGCAGCARGIKSEGYPSPQGREHRPSLPTPHPLTPLSEPDESPARLRLARERPQRPSQASSGGTAAPPGNAARRLLLDRKQPGPAPLPSPGAGQRRASRRRATNGWRPVGVPTEREVFIAGEDETALRRCYDGVERDGEVIHIRDTVLLRSGPRKKSLPFVAKISALWEDPKTGELMMSLFWYYRPEHTQGGRDARAHCENEIFASRHQDENSVACIEDRCYVLPLAQYCRFCALVKRRGEGAQPGGARVVPGRPDFAPPSHRCVPADVDPHLVYLCRHVYDFRYGRILKNLQ